MSRLQHTAATLVQLRQSRLTQRATEFLDAFISEELAHDLVPASLVEALKTRHAETLAAARATQETTESVAEQLCASFLREAVGDCVLEVFQTVLDSMVREYMTTRTDLSRAATLPTAAIAGDILTEWLNELQKELLPEAVLLTNDRAALDEMVVEYMDFRYIILLLQKNARVVMLNLPGFDDSEVIDKDNRFEHVTAL
ncbi:hypothetical protein PybrP1_008055, partial [[Pythium] brassicae (nom. inval.)]